MPSDSIAGAVTLLGLPDLSCVKDLNEFAQALASKLLVQFPEGGAGVSVSVSEPTNPAAVGIWVRIDTAGMFVGLYVFSGGTWVQLSLGGGGGGGPTPPNGCDLASVASGALLVCNGGAATPLAGSIAGKVLTLTNAGANTGAYTDPYSNTVQGTLTSPTLGGKNLTNADTTFTSAVVDIVVTNSSLYKFKDVGLTACLTIDGETHVSNDDYITVSFALQYALNGGAYSALRLVKDSFMEPTGLFIPFVYRQVCVALPLGLAQGPAAVDTIHLRGQVILTYPDGSSNGRFVVLASTIHALAMGISL